MTEICVVSSDDHGPFEPVATAAPLGSDSSAFPALAPTAEAVWAAWAVDLAPLPWAARRVLVIAPHPDDETLGCGGLVHDLAADGCEVRVVTVTDGEASHRGWPDLAAARRREQRAAIASLGLAGEPIFLGLADGAVARHGSELADLLEPEVREVDLVVAPWEHDGHADHDAVGRVTRTVGSRAGVAVLAHPVWAWQWAVVEDLAGPRWFRHDLAPEVQHAKVAALSCYRSQTSGRHGPPVLGPEVLARADRTYEVYARVG